MGGHIRAYAPDDGALAQQFPQWLDLRYPDMTMSGTSQAAAVTSGVVALMLEANPLLSPNNVKCRLMDGARPAVRSDGHLAYSVFQQGSGLVNAQDALYSTGIELRQPRLECRGRSRRPPALRRSRQPGCRRQLLHHGSRQTPMGLLTTLLSPLGSLPCSANCWSASPRRSTVCCGTAARRPTTA